MGIQNTPLYQGIAFIPIYRTINENTQYFLTYAFLDGSVKYAGQAYNDQQLKYDVYEDKVLLKLVSSVGGATMELIPEWLDEFIINGHRFVHLRPTDTPSLSKYGFYEVATKGSVLTLYTKHNMERIDQRDEKFVYYEFFPEKSTYVLLYNDEYHIINSKSDLLRLLPEYKKQIRQFTNHNRKLKRDNPDGFYQALIYHMNGVVR
ncbi:hypothetical protein DMZ48_15075 [Robertkochia solimangrovi]|nr:hypothetical protein DMZ48_15075 [Robertkochia solimangrovi]